MADLSEGSDCGGYTYVLEYEDGPLSSTQLDLSVYEIQPDSDGSLKFAAKLEDTRAEGTHKLRIKCINGVEDLSEDARGVNGMYNHVYSNTIEVRINNPCRSSVVNDNAALAISDLIVPEGETSMDYSYAGPTNSIS